MGGVFMELDGQKFFKKGDKVVRIKKAHALHNIPVGTLGVVTEVIHHGAYVKWDTGVIAGCNFDNMQLVTAKSNFEAKGLLDKEW
jgi:hypothetical protein